jgi:hypothetical protein
VYRQNSSNPSIESYRLADEIAGIEIEGEGDNITLKQSYINLMAQLEIDGIPKEKISTIGSQIITTKKKNRLQGKAITESEVNVGTWWYVTAREQGYIDLHYSHPKDIESKNKKPTHKTNQRYVDNLKRTKEICTELIKKFEESEDIEKSLDKKQLQFLNHEWDAVLDIAENTFNEKTKVPLNLQNLLLVEAATASSITFAGMTFLKSNYIQYEKIGAFLTTKQIGHIQNGITRKSLPLFKPDSRDTALFQKYYGLSCPECKSWRVYELIAEKSDGSNLGCYDCGISFKEKTVSKCRYCQIPLYKERLVPIIKTGRCEECNNENNLPEELVEYADSDHKIRDNLEIQ